MKSGIRLKKKILKSLGQRIQNIRKEKNLTQENLAEMIDSDRSYIGAIEQGRKSPSFYCLILIAKALNVKIKDLVDIDID